MGGNEFFFWESSGVGFFPNGLENVSLNMEKFLKGYIMIKLANSFNTPKSDSA